MPKIKVHEKALGHLSRGLYRSPASALRELVSNAWDANATVVRMTTNFPNFFQIVVEDNGTGFSSEEFVNLMEGGIGNSEKALSRIVSSGRPLIGRLGIGMLGIAQICLGFRIISRPKTGKGFSARIHLYDLLKESLDRNDPAVTRQESGTREVDVGDYEIDESFDLRNVRIGTTIIADDVHPTFVRAFQDSVTFKGFKRPPKEWSDFLKVVSRERSLQELGDYWRLIWELSASCPVPYINDRAVPHSLIAADQKTLKSYNFKVLVDGLELRKPINLHGNPDGYTYYHIQPQTKRIYDKDLIFHGYIVVQEGSQLRPDELRGIMIRIKNVGIGYYDPSFLDYRINQGPRSRWLTGEIIVDKGLEDALNIDRDSFNRFHPEFRAIQEYVHNILETQIFPKVYREIEKRSAERSEEKEKARSKTLRQTVSDFTTHPVKLKKQSQDDKDSNETPTVSVEYQKNQTSLVLPSPEDLDTKKGNRQLAVSILAIFEIATRQKTRSEQRKVFTELLLKLLARW
jgi:hypothetical protein